MKFYKRWIGSYQKDTAHLSLAQHGAYTLMLDIHYATERPLPRDRAAVHRLLRAFTRGERAAVDAVLDQFWTETGDGWVNPRARTVMGEARARSEQAREAAHARWATADADAMRSAMRDRRQKTEDKRQKTETETDISIPSISSDPNIEVNHALSRSPQKNGGEPRPGSGTANPPDPPVGVVAAPPSDPPRASDRAAVSGMGRSGGERVTASDPPPVSVRPAVREPSPDPAADVERVFTTWREVMGRGRARLDDKRRRLIRRALALGYGVEDLELAVRGCAATPHNMGVNDQGTRYDDLGLILRDGDHIDRFMRNARHPPRPATAADSRLAANVAAAREAMEMDDREPGAA